MQEPTAKLKFYFPPSRASAQPFSPTNRQIVMEQVGSHRQYPSGVQRCLSPEKLSPSLCWPSKMKEGEMSRLSTWGCQCRFQQQGNLTEKNRPKGVERPEPTRAVVRRLPPTKPKDVGKKERGNKPLSFVILYVVHLPWKEEKGPATKLASPPCSAPPNWPSIIPSVQAGGAFYIHSPGRCW